MSETTEKCANNTAASSGSAHTIACRPISEASSVTELSSSNSSLLSDPNSPMCKICHMNAKDGDPLISPCRCAGTMQFIHCGCLMRWSEISSKKSRKPLSCELCQYQYHWHKKFKVRHWQFPHCSRRDKILHVIFFLSVAVMIACAAITVMCFKHDRGHRIDPHRTELTESEIVTLICGVLFFLAFFTAMYVEVKSRNTLYKLLVKFIYLNQQWYIDEYEKKENSPVEV
ncbi:E3 ubiquitin-protein ligase MARCH1-like protein [Leptotrombidium deliense]|uniref:E3 ubiquitin-protein ligase MARCH1-like protein n=1 Tax=Leptotrombidium deliense TaxID=299467 RepID=A0A443SW58_9ACAR|nr:E3 ubiquitin-protein ligase MARCH1-like protein [Leptotrombidium deliense]